jgi:hypothetical protein
MLKSGDNLFLMKNFTSKGQHNCARWILMFGVLACLFFSGGEGIRLLPFSIAEAGNLINTFSVTENKLKSYALSIGNSGSVLPQLKSKFQKHINQYLRGGHLIFDWSSPRAKLFSPSARFCEKANTSCVSVFLSLQSDRAPPTV